MATLDAHDPERLRQVAEAIRKNGALAEVAAGVDEPDEEAPEGRVLLRAHKIQERNRGLVQRRKALAMKQHGKLACEACGFDFQAIYGELGEGRIACHHTVPVSQLQPGQSQGRATWCWCARTVIGWWIGGRRRQLRNRSNSCTGEAARSEPAAGRSSFMRIETMDDEFATIRSDGD